jgi:hypothetical protein
MHSTKLQQVTLTLVLLVLPAAAAAQIVNFAQFDISQDTRNLALVRTLPDNNPQRPDPLLSAGYTRWDTGSSAQLGYMHRWALTSGRQHNWAVGAGVGVNRFDSRQEGSEDDSGPSLRVQTELSGPGAPAAPGSYFALLQLSTFRQSLFGVVSYSLQEYPVGFELSRYREKDYRQWTWAVRYALDSPRRWFFRTGVIESQDDVQVFVGLAYNAF